MSRRTWSEIKNEHVSRVAMNGAKGYSDRAYQFLSAAYFDLAALFHHPELDANVGIDVAVGNAFAALPADVNVVFSCNLLDNATIPLTEIVPSEFRSVLEFQEAHSLMQDFSTAPAEPKHWSRYGDQIIFKAQTDIDYTVHLFYYKTPAEPDFKASNSEMAEIWDERILELSVLRAKTALWRPDLGQADSEVEMLTFYQFSGYPLLRDHPLFPRPERRTIDSPHGGPIT